LADTDLETVRSFLGYENIIFYEGLFKDTFRKAENEKFCFVHIDSDLYESVKQCCEFFYPRMIQGGIMIFDDYGFIRYIGARQAVDDFFAEKPEHGIYLPTGQYMILKVS